MSVCVCCAWHINQCTVSAVYTIFTRKNHSYLLLYVTYVHNPNVQRKCMLSGGFSWRFTCTYVHTQRIMLGRTTRRTIIHTTHLYTTVGHRFNGSTKRLLMLCTRIAEHTNAHTAFGLICFFFAAPLRSLSLSLFLSLCYLLLLLPPLLYACVCVCVSFRLRQSHRDVVVLSSSLFLQSFKFTIIFARLRKKWK